MYLSSTPSDDRLYVDDTYRWAQFSGPEMFDFLFSEMQIAEAIALHEWGYDVDLADGGVKAVIWR